MICLDLFPIPQLMLQSQPILGEISELTFIWHAGVLKWIGISLFQFKNIQWQYLSCILCKFDGPVTPDITKVENVTFWMTWQK